MKIPKAFTPIIRITKYTLMDEIRQKSLIVMFVICTLFILLIRGCYHGNFVVNGEALDADTIVRAISKITFHVIAAGVMLLAALLSMRVFKRDRDDGMQSCILSKPITRWQYIAGKVLGLWVLSTVFMFILHGIVFVIVSINLKAVMPEYLVASLLCSFNLLFVVVAVFFLSLLMPDIVAFLSVLGIGVIGLVADGIFAVSHSQTAQLMMNQTVSSSDLTWWKVVYYMWPKLSGMQQFASSLIGSTAFSDIRSVYPLFNIAIYVFILGTLLLRRFRKEDVT
jgi:ABC-type transport system involved in multi-copper enzyme maturation permease subunit